MGFIQPNLPVVDMAEWSKGTRAQRIVPMARHIAENGFGTPLVMPVMYGIKIVLYILGAYCSPCPQAVSRASATSARGGRNRSCSRRPCSTRCCSRW
ncbi:hypothetical protein YM3MPS_38420 [Mycobacterium pseudoshottsii]|nr:Membrane protein [Mycobacterium pseudoshottsii]RFZ61236.1 hypothetical protein DL240490_03515 [Mycobacterium marinum]BEH78039.1 hypothetical protein YM3MPS_38420 [Mycobacterium pseudoshottsii]